MARVLHLRGTLASQQGDPSTARTAYQASLEVRRELGDEAGVAAMLTNLALVAEDEGDLDLAERIGTDALARRRALGDRRAESVSLTNMGMLATARGELDVALSRFQEAQALAEEVGDPWVVAVGHHNLGNAARDLGRRDQVADHLQAALAGYADRDDRWSLAHLFEDVAVWRLSLGREHDLEAARLLGAALAVREEIGAPRFPHRGGTGGRVGAGTRSEIAADPERVRRRRPAERRRRPGSAARARRGGGPRGRSPRHRSLTPVADQGEVTAHEAGLWSLRPRLSLGLGCGRRARAGTGRRPLTGAGRRGPDEHHGGAT